MAPVLPGLQRQNHFFSSASSNGAMQLKILLQAHLILPSCQDPMHVLVKHSHYPGGFLDQSE